MSTVRIAVAGAGLIGLRHIEEIGNSRSRRARGDRRRLAEGRGVARSAGVPLFASLAELFGEGRPDGVIIATPNQLHVEQALECIAARVPALIEKPVAHTLDEGIRLCEAAERAGARMLVGHHRRHSPILHKAVEIVRSGVLGPLVGVIGSAVFYKPDAEGYYEGANAWRRQPGGGPILINMIHEIGNLRAMVGEITAVQAFASNATRGFEVEDTVAITCASTTARWAPSCSRTRRPRPGAGSRRRGRTRPTRPATTRTRYTIIGTNGSLGVPTMRLRRYARTGPVVVQAVRDPHRAARAQGPARAADRALRRGDPRRLRAAGHVRDGLANLRVTDAIAEAARTGGVVETSLAAAAPASLFQCHTQGKR